MAPGPETCVVQGSIYVRGFCTKFIKLFDDSAKSVRLARPPSHNISYLFSDRSLSQEVRRNAEKYQDHASNSLHRFEDPASGAGGHKPLETRLPSNPMSQKGNRKRGPIGIASF